jgi:hypothetical protein
MQGQLYPCSRSERERGRERQQKAMRGSERQRERQTERQREMEAEAGMRGRLQHGCYDMSVVFWRC